MSLSNCLSGKKSSQLYIYTYLRIICLSPLRNLDGNTPGSMKITQHNMLIGGKDNIGITYLKHKIPCLKNERKKQALLTKIYWFKDKNNECLSYVINVNIIIFVVHSLLSHAIERE